MDSEVIDGKNLEKLKKLGNSHVEKIVNYFIELCKPKKVTIIADDPHDITYVKGLCLKNGEEEKLKLEGHTVHFDGPRDLARDVGSTKVLLSKGKKLSKHINTIDRDEGLREILGFLAGVMKGKEMLVGFFCLGPRNSKFSIPAFQITDSAYVAHSEDLLFRPGYEEFKRLNGSDRFLHFIHSAGELENGVSKNIDKRRVYIDLQENRVLSVNNQYAGNSLGLKKPALRLAINMAEGGNWLAEHMFIMGARPIKGNRTTYFLGAFPSACGKTSTAMIPGQTIVGDDIAYIRRNKKNEACAANIECGIFGIIKDINPADDPLIHKTLTTPREAIFSNVLVVDGVPYWLGMGKPLPKKGINFSGEWFEGKKDETGEEISAAHPNARYTIRISDLENADPKANDPEGVPVSGIIYGGRDSDTSVPVLQSFTWQHGVFIGASLESETTSATIGAQGVRKQFPMANIDFIVIPLGEYIGNHLRFGIGLSKKPPIFSTNYFLKEGDKFLTDKLDKKVWLMWMEGRVHGEFGAIDTPVGRIPKYEDLKNLFKKVFNREFPRELYVKLFSIRIQKFLEKMDRIEKIYREEEGVPAEFFNQLNDQRKRLQKANEKFGEIASPFDFA